jgi:hypothetical protein
MPSASNREIKIPSKIIPIAYTEIHGVISQKTVIFLYHTYLKDAEGFLLSVSSPLYVILVKLSIC